MATTGSDSEAGAETQRRFRYQNAYGLILLLEPKMLGRPPYQSIRCEEKDDFLAEVSADEWHAFQIKTWAKPTRSWRIGDDAVRRSLARFCALRQTFPQITRFHFVSNREVSWSPSRPATDPADLCERCRDEPDFESWPETARAAFGSLVEALAPVHALTLREVLRRTHFVAGPSLHAFETEIRETYFDRWPAVGSLSSEERRRLFEVLVGRIGTAAASPVEARKFCPPPNWIDESLLADGLKAVRAETESVQRLLWPIRSSSRNTGGVQNFLQHYTARREVPVPFGGREAELAVLNRWLDSPGSPPYFLLCAPAAQGKSALLVHWVRQLQASGREVVFYPVSQRFNTNAAGGVFAALCAAVAPGTAGDLDAVAAREAFSAALHELPPDRSLLVVIDGLDEALDWAPDPSLFPVDPPVGLRVLVSARPLLGDVGSQQWLQRLGWTLPRSAQVIEKLAPLTVAQIGLLAEEIGTATAHRVAERVYELSDGDPFLVRHYLEACREVAAGVDPVAMLATHRPGYRGVFDREIKACGDEPDGVRQLLAVLAVAPGPIWQSDLEALGLATRGREQRGGLARLLIGDGKAAGLAFSHPKLQSYYAEQQMQPSERTEWLHRLREYGWSQLQDLLAGRLEPDRVSGFAVQHLGALLEMTKASNDALGVLAHWRWADACYARNASYDGFLDDLARLIRRHNVQSGWSPERLRFGLIQARINSAGEALAPVLVAALIDDGHWTIDYAIRYVQKRPRTEYGPVLAPRVPDVQVEELLAYFVEVVKPESTGAESVRGIAAFLPRLTPDRRSQILSLLKARVLGNPYQLERMCAVAEVLPHLREQSARAELLALVAQRLDNAESCYPMGYQRLLPVLDPAERKPFVEAAWRWSGIEAWAGAPQKDHFDREGARIGLRNFVNDFGLILPMLSPERGAGMVRQLIALAEERESAADDSLLIAVWRQLPPHHPARAELLRRIDQAGCSFVNREARAEFLLGLWPDVTGGRREMIRAELMEIGLNPADGTECLSLLPAMDSCLGRTVVERFATRRLEILAGDSSARWTDGDCAALLRHVPVALRARALWVGLLRYRHALAGAHTLTSVWAWTALRPQPAERLRLLVGRMEKQLTFAGRRGVIEALCEMPQVPGVDELARHAIDLVDKLSLTHLNKLLRASTSAVQRRIVAAHFCFAPEHLARVALEEEPLLMVHRDRYVDTLRLAAALGAHWPDDAAGLLLAVFESDPGCGMREGGLAREMALPTLATVLPTRWLERAWRLADRFEDAEAVTFKRQLLARADVPESWLVGPESMQSSPGAWLDPVAAARGLAWLRRYRSNASSAAMVTWLTGVPLETPHCGYLRACALLVPRLPEQAGRRALSRLEGSMDPNYFWVNASEALVELLDSTPAARTPFWSDSLRASLTYIEPMRRQALVGQAKEWFGPSWVDKLADLVAPADGSAWELMKDLLPTFSVAVRVRVTRHWLERYGKGVFPNLGVLMPGLKELPTAELWRWWHTLLPLIAERGWASLQIELANMAPVLGPRLDGNEQDQVVALVEDVAKWWRTAEPNTSPQPSARGVGFSPGSS